MYFGHLAHGNLFHVDLSKIKKRRRCEPRIGCNNPASGMAVVSKEAKMHELDPSFGNPTRFEQSRKHCKNNIF
jgi:hypothetical protein